MQLLKVLDIWTERLEAGGQIDVVYTDFEKAFDRVPHKRLISKLESYGVNKDIIAWIAAFLYKRKQRVRINGVYSSWTEVISGVPQGSVLGPLLFVIYVNDLIHSCANSEVFLYADDSKIFKHITKEEDSQLLQRDINNVKLWLDKWLVTLNIKKCKTVSFGHHKNFDNTYFISHNGELHSLEKVDIINDLGVTFDSRLKFDQHISTKIHKANSLLGLIRRNFSNLSIPAFLLLYKSLVRPHLEYANCVWSPYRKTYIKDIEKVQMRATKLVAQVKKLSYEERLKNLDLPTLKYRRLRGDMIEVYKMLHGIYDNSTTIGLPLSGTDCTRGHKFKLVKTHMHYDLRKYFFSNRVVNVWNSLPAEVVEATSVNSFKNNFDKFFANCDLKFNYELTSLDLDMFSL